MLTLTLKQMLGLILIRRPTRGSILTLKRVPGLVLKQVLFPKQVQSQRLKIYLPELFQDLTEAILAGEEYKHLLDKLLDEGGVSPYEHTMFQKISYLPSDPEGLWEKLKVLGAEYKAGNKTTRNELVAVLDELKRQNQITREEYIDMNTKMGSGIDALWQKLKVIGPEYKAGNHSKEMVAILDELLKENEINEEEYSNMLKRGSGIQNDMNFNKRPRYRGGGTSFSFFKRKRYGRI